MSGLLLMVAIGSAVGGFYFLKRYHERPAVADPVAGTETWTVEEIEALRQGSEEVGTRLRRQVGIVAVVGPGPDGVLTTPEGGVECVWWRMDRTRHYVEWSNGRQYPATERIGQNWSRAAFTLSDETGTLVVRPDDAEVVGAPEVFSRSEEFEPDGSALDPLLGRQATTDVVYVEHALKVGAKIFVHGEARDWDKEFVTISKPLDGGPLILSTRHERIVRSEAEEQRTMDEMTRWKGYGLIALAVLAVILFYAT